MDTDHMCKDAFHLLVHCLACSITFGMTLIGVNRFMLSVKDLNKQIHTFYLKNHVFLLKADN